jgi:hypothetical protein
MKTWKLTDSGRLVINRWSFGERDNDPPHRHSTLATHTFPNGDHVNLKCNRRCKGQAYWLTGSGEGFAGASSRVINSVRTRKPEVIEAWRKAIESGNVEII